MRHIMESMIGSRHSDARAVVQVYLRATRAGLDAERAAVAEIARRRKGLTLDEPRQMLGMLLAWIEENHGEWWGQALAQPPRLDGLSVRELYRRGYVVATTCPRHSALNSRIVYSVFEIEAIVGPNTYVLDTLPLLRCPRCKAPVAGTILRDPDLAAAMAADDGSVRNR